MTIVLSLVCPACGARVRSTGDDAWLRCAFCRALVGLDVRGYQVALQRTQSALVAGGVNDYVEQSKRTMKLHEKGLAAADAGEHELALAFFEDMTRASMSSTMQYPAEVRSDAAYAERYVRRDAWVMLAQRVHPELRRASEGMTTAAQGFSMSNPLPTFERVVAANVEQGRLVERIEQTNEAELPKPPPDPDGLAPPARFRIYAQMWAAAYAGVMDAAVLAKALAIVYGRDAVIVTEGDDEHGLFFEFLCPRCGLVSLTTRTERRWTCYGCMRVYPHRPELLEARASVLPCGSCGALVAFPDRAVTSKCAHCGAAARRVVDDGKIQREMIEGLVGADRHLPPEGEGGFPLGASNHMTIVLDGLDRMATTYATMITPARFARIVASTFSHATASELDAVFDALNARNPANASFLASARAALDPKR